MNIAIIANTEIPAIAYGGTQRVVYDLALSLKELGHNVTLVVKQLTKNIPINTIIYNPNIPLSTQLPSDIEVLHFHDNNLPNDTTIPYARTMHGNPNSNEKIDINTIFVSKNHAQRYNSNSYVHNGLLWDHYKKPSLTHENYYHFLGNGSWRVKNLKGAIKIAKKSNIHLKVIGANRFNFKMGLRFTFTPKVSFYGTIGGVKKDEILDKSKGFIFPARWNEPFGLAIIESLYFGNPVFATPYGSIQELIPQDVGFLSTHASEIIEAIHNNSYNQYRCHEYANDCFSSKIMALNYLKKYEKVLNKHPLNNEAPFLKNNSLPKLLPFYE